MEREDTRPLTKEKQVKKKHIYFLCLLFRYTYMLYMVYEQ